jgi:hypothetical protein
MGFLLFLLIVGVLIVALTFIGLVADLGNLAAPAARPFILAGVFVSAVAAVGVATGFERSRLDLAWYPVIGAGVALPYWWWSFSRGRMTLNSLVIAVIAVNAYFGLVWLAAETVTFSVID